MTAKILDGKLVRSHIVEDLKQKVSSIPDEERPHLTFILVGNNPSSLSYIRQKQKACQAIGFQYEFLHFPESITEPELLQKIFDLNDDPSTHGIMVQLPLPKHIDPSIISSTIDPIKDVDGFHPTNQGNLFTGKYNPERTMIPCTPKGIIKLLNHYNINPSGKKAVVVGRSQIVGKPVAAMLLNAGATVTICHSQTKDLAQETTQADILVVAIGKPNFITDDMVKPDTVVIDVGFSKVEDDIYGDVDQKGVAAKASFLTPVPGGVGPMTVACLMDNLYLAYKAQQ